MRILLWWWLAGFQGGGGPGGGPPLVNRSGGLWCTTAGSVRIPLYKFLSVMSIKMHQRIWRNICPSWSLETQIFAMAKLCLLEKNQMDSSSITDHFTLYIGISSTTPSSIRSFAVNVYLNWSRDRSLSPHLPSLPARLLAKQAPRKAIAADTPSPGITLHIWVWLLKFQASVWAKASH